MYNLMGFSMFYLLGYGNVIDFVYLFLYVLFFLNLFN